MILLDTSALFRWAFDPQDLSEAALRSLQEADVRIINAISLWELGWKVRSRKLWLPISIKEFALQLSQVERLRIDPTDMAIWLHSLELNWEHRDPADRVLVAAADLLGCPLLTSDRRILDFYPRALW